jgi:hypothetical protein
MRVLWSVGDIYLYADFNPTKRARCLTKFYELSESNSDCWVISKIWTGDDLVEGSDKNTSVRVLLELAESVLVKGYILYLYNCDHLPSCKWNYMTEL